MAQNYLQNYYELFGVNEDADFDEIKAKFHEKVRQLHPDKRTNDLGKNAFAFMTKLLNLQMVEKYQARRNKGNNFGKNISAVYTDGIEIFSYDFEKQNITVTCGQCNDTMEVPFQLLIDKKYNAIECQTCNLITRLDENEQLLILINSVPQL